MTPTRPGNGVPLPERQAVAAALAAARQVGMPVVAVGANARLLAFDGPLGLTPPRTTLDWDFAARCDSWPDYQRLREACLAAGFKPGNHEHEVLHTETGVKVDLVPFGKLESAQGRITWPDSGFTMNVRGLPEAMAAATPVNLGPPAGEVAVPPTPVLVALKILAHGDRGGRDDRDLRDLWHLITHYPSDDLLRAYEPPLEALVAREDFDAAHLSPLLAGADVAAACHAATLDDLLPILTALGDPNTPQLWPLVGGHYDEEQQDRRRREVADSFRWMRLAIEAAALP